MRLVYRFVWILLISAAIGTAAFAGDDQPAAAAGDVQGSDDDSSVEVNFDFFESRIRPVLVEHCYECHSTQSQPLQGGLRLDDRDGLAAGGDSGAAIDSKQPRESLLIKALRYDGIEMPPKGKLPPDVIADFEKWIQSGAPDPREESAAGSGRVMVDAEKAAAWWSFQPVSTPAVPELARERPGHALPEYGPIDRFLNAAMRTAGLVAAPEADRYTLLRRLSFDLIGLPPTIEQMDAFVNDAAPDAYPRLVDRLLASPRFGERWGRMWLDAARYADSNGADENHAFPVAWKYRDWVVRAFNSDLPYDQFVVQQLAGDLLPYESIEQRTELWTATGFLILGPKMLAEQDKPKMLADIVDEQIDTVGQAFMGMTFGCARCHDHKFDPILARDYYAMAGVFHSTKTMANTDFVSQWNERELPDEEKQKEVDAYRAKVDAAKKEVEQMIAATGKKEKELSGEELKPIKEARKKIEEMEKAAPQMPKVMAADEATVKTVPIHIRGNHLQLGKDPIDRAVPGIFVSTTGVPQFPTERSGRLEFARWLTSGRHPLVARVLVNRLWQGHFGEGLVRTPGNFGLTGQPPTHPELLDYLATQMVQHDWSMKDLHREILLSAAYRRASTPVADSASSADSPSIDLENKYWSRQNRRRLEVEPLRDAILMMGDNLDARIGGQAEAIYGDYQTSQSARGIDGALRRTIYLPVNRAALSELLSTFDYVEAATSVAKRNSTIVPHQALFLMNNPLVIEQALLLSRRSAAACSDDRSRLDFIVRSALGRPAAPGELRVALSFLADNSAGSTEDAPSASQSNADGSGNEELVARRARAWHRLCLSILCTTQFMTID